MNDYIFEDVNAAMSHILELEKCELMKRSEQTKDLNVISPANSHKIGGPFYSYFNDAEDEKFIMTPLQSGRYSLKPNLRNRAFLFRGQSNFINNCVPSLFRHNKDYFLDDCVFAQEMNILLLSHPLCQLFDLGFNVNNYMIRFEINLMGLSQHYGNHTKLLDFTSDPDAAKFFAVTDYESDEYVPVVDEGRIGCLYYYQLDIEEDFNLSRDSGTPRLSTIGLQVFPRSERQKGFLLNLNINENLNDKSIFPRVNYVKFYHKADVSRGIFLNAKNGDLYFPNDILCEHLKHARDKRQVSLQAVHWNTMVNDGETHKSIKQKLYRNFNITTRNYQPSFTTDELATYYQDIKNGWWEAFVDKIYIPRDRDGKIREGILRLPLCDDYSWAFRPDTKYHIDYKKGYLLKEYERFLK